MKRNVLYACVVFILMTNASLAQTVHVINFCNTLDPKIGCDVDYERTTREAALIAGFLNYDIRWYNGKGENCSNENLMTTLTSLECGSDDIVIFYYSGHGSRSFNDQSEYPQLCLKYPAYQQDKWVPMHTVIEKLQLKKARFTLIISDCCNKAQYFTTAKSEMSNDGGTISETDQIGSIYRKLFLENKGTVIMTSSKKGQVSYPTEKNGGVFSYVLFERALYAAYNGLIPATWEDVLETVSLITKDFQEPYYTIDLVQVPPQPSQSQSVSPVIAVDAIFAHELSALLDTDHSEDWRLEQAEYLAKKHFTNDAMVATVGRNGTTIIEYESARDFLRRIAASKLIVKMNVISETTDTTGKRNYIKVQEIRKPK